jgi:hypothetical protein
LFEKLRLPGYILGYGNRMGKSSMKNLLDVSPSIAMFILHCAILYCFDGLSWMRRRAMTRLVALRILEGKPDGFRF